MRAACRTGHPLRYPCEGTLLASERTDRGAHSGAAQRPRRRPHTAGHPRACREYFGGSSHLIALRIVSRCSCVLAPGLPDRQPAHEPQAPDLRPLLHPDHPSQARSARTSPGSGTTGRRLRWFSFQVVHFRVMRRSPSVAVRWRPYGRNHRDRGPWENAGWAGRASVDGL